MNYAGMTKQEKHAAVENAQSVEELDSMWLEFHRVGHAYESLLYAAVLRRKQQLGVELNEMEAANLNLMTVRADAGAKLPPIEGKLHGGR